MNKLTEALAKQAAEYAIEFAAQDQALYMPKLMEKFAKLIVEECVGLLMKPAVMEWNEKLKSELSAYNSGWVNGRLLGVEHIKEHFGVKP